VPTADKLAVFQILPSNPCAGNVFQEPVRTLVGETTPSVSGPPGNSSEFQARAGFFLRAKKPSWFFNALRVLCIITHPRGGYNRRPGQKIRNLKNLGYSLYLHQ